MILRHFRSVISTFKTERCLAFSFSSYFEQKDKLEIKNITPKPVYYKPYQKMLDMWKKPLEKKKLRQQRIKLIKEAKKPHQPQEQKFIVHNAVHGIENTIDIFCLVDIDGFQCKINEGCTIILDNRPNMKVGQEITLNKVMLVGAKDFTVLGRPYLNEVSVKAVVQQKRMSRKLIVLKKKRRKQYRRSIGFSTPLTILRIIKIDFKLTDNLLGKAVALE